MPNPVNDENKVKLTIEEGAIYRREATKKVKTKDDWTMCFLKYIAVMMQRKINKTPPMISYMTTILQAANASTGFGWRQYDEQFRLKLAAFPGMKWDVIDNHLWLRCIISPQPEIAEAKEPSVKIEKPRQPFSQPRGGNSRPRGRGRGRGAGPSNNAGYHTPSPNCHREIPNTCDYYNRSHCSKKGCSFSHICSGCGGNHPLFKCIRK